jgi:DNA mismatch repair ATPase MutS
VTAGVETPAADLKILSLLVERIEREHFKSPRLAALRSALDIEGLPASKRISKLTMWMDFLDSADHLAVRVFGPSVLWREQVAMGIEAWRRESGPHVSAWLAAVAEFEALSSIASVAFERPDWIFPELVEHGPVFEAEELRHPLMNPRRCVPNDVKLGGGIALYIVSGSNMSGKSTLLRAIGLNTVLAWAGGPVAARRMAVSPLAVGASMRVVDSLQDGRSRFYAEITRLRQVVDLTASDRPAMFLLDELLSGTNSHDRKIGAEAIVRSLVERGAIGLVTTHDLALTQIADTIGGRAINVHFEDHMEDGRISFDYKMRPGVVERSNALELMRAVGLSV